MDIKLGSITINGETVSREEFEEMHPAPQTLCALMRSVRERVLSTSRDKT